VAKILLRARNALLQVKTGHYQNVVKKLINSNDGAQSAGNKDADLAAMRWSKEEFSFALKKQRMNGIPVLYKRPQAIRFLRLLARKM